MKSIEYIKKKLQFLHDKFNNLNIGYQYKSFLNTHVIDVRPKDVFENDESYALLQLSIEDEFEELFPQEEIVFVSEDSLISINNPIFEIKSVEVVDINVEDFAILESDQIYYDDFINIEMDEESIPYDSFEDIDYVQVESDLDNEIIINPPPSKSWWKSIINKKDSKKDLEFFFT